MITIIPSGSYYCIQKKCGIFYWGVHGRDGIWHLAVSAISFQHFPFIHPTFSGAILSGYNILLDYVVYILSYSGLSNEFIYFKILPIIWFILFTYVSVKLARTIRASSLFTFFLLFFLYFGASFSYIFRIYHHKTLWGSSGMLTMQAIQSLTNLQVAYSFLILLLILLFMRTKKYNYITVSLLFTLVFFQFGIKFYAGVISIIMVFVYILAHTTKKNYIRILFYEIFLGIVALVSILLFYNPTQASKTGLSLFFMPLGTVHSIIEESDLFYIPQFANARYYLLSHGIGPKLIAIETFSLLIFLFFNLGTRIFGVIYIMRKIIVKKITKIDLVIITGIGFSIFFATFFTQKGVWFNTIQFFYYAVFLLNIYTAEFIFKLFNKKKKYYIAFGILILLLTLPNNIDAMKDFLTPKKGYYVVQDELLALRFLKKQPYGVIYTSLYNPKRKIIEAEPYPLYIYDDTAYVTAFTNKPTYFSDNLMLDVTGVDYKDRLSRLKRYDCNIFKEVQYVYEIKDQNDYFIKTCKKYEPNKFREIYKNNKVIIYSITK
jgi:hypothetical protein